MVAVMLRHVDPGEYVISYEQLRDRMREELHRRGWVIRREVDLSTPEWLEIVDFVKGLLTP